MSIFMLNTPNKENVMTSKEIFYLIYYDSSKYLYDGPPYGKTIQEIAELTLSDEEYDDAALVMSDDGDYDYKSMSDEEWMNYMDVSIIDNREEAVESAVRPDVKYYGITLDDDIKIYNTSSKILEIFEQFSVYMSKRGWERIRFKNLSAYYEPNSLTHKEMGYEPYMNRVRVRLSDHNLGYDQSDRKQTGGAHIDIVIDNNTNVSDVIEEFEAQIKEYI